MPRHGNLPAQVIAVATHTGSPVRERRAGWSIEN
jgi:hypothetical protein